MGIIIIRKICLGLLKEHSAANRDPFAFWLTHVKLI